MQNFKTKVDLQIVKKWSTAQVVLRINNFKLSQESHDLIFYFLKFLSIIFYLEEILETIHIDSNNEIIVIMLINKITLQ